MASSYGNNFGFRRSDEHMRSGTEGRFKVAKEGTFYQGDLVEIDPTEEGYIKKSAANAPLIPGVRGLLIQENSHIRAIGARTRHEVDDAAVDNDQLCAIWTGAGIKVWVKNTDARTIVTTSDLAVGETVAWDGGKWVETGSEANAVGTVTEVSDGYAEFVLNR